MTDAAEVQVTDSKAGRCFYVAHAYLTTGKQLEAHALFGRAAAHAKQAVRQHQVQPCVVPQNKRMATSGCSPLLSMCLSSTSNAVCSLLQRADWQLGLLFPRCRTLSC